MFHVKHLPFTDLFHMKQFSIKNSQKTENLSKIRLAHIKI